MTAEPLLRDAQAFGGAVIKPHRPRTRVAMSWVRPINRLSRPRAPFEHQIEGSTLRLVVDQLCLGGAPAVPDATEIGFALDDGSRFAVRLPSAAVQRIFAAIQPELTGPVPEPAGSLLLELALAPLLDAVEPVLGQSLRISGVGPAAAEPGSAVLVLTATFGTDTVPMQVDLGPATAAIEPDRLAALLRLVESAPPRAARVGKLPVLLAFVAGHVRLTRADLEGLAPNDTILPDVWHPARGEVAVTLAGRFAARAAMERGAVRLKGPFEPITDDVALGKA